ncbi:MAG: hypothetical protein ACYC4L_10785 [Chloroflexota bacterium]
MGEMLSTSNTSEQAENVATCLSGFRPGACLNDLRFLARAHATIQPLLKEAEELVELLGPEPGLSVRGKLGRRLLALSDKFLVEAAALSILDPATVAELQSDPDDDVLIGQT